MLVKELVKTLMIHQAYVIAIPTYSVKETSWVQVEELAFRRGYMDIQESTLTFNVLECEVDNISVQARDGGSVIYIMLEDI